jgi:hypothetical protein
MVANPFSAMAARVATLTPMRPSVHQICTSTRKIWNINFFCDAHIALLL